MSSKSDWLPDLVLLEDYGGDWLKYEGALYEYFEEDFLQSRPKYRNKDVKLIKEKYYNDKHPTFWHIISSGPNEEPNLRRCERIRWVKPIIVNYNSTKIEEIPAPQESYRDKRIQLWLRPEDFLVVLAERKNYFVLWTAYCIFGGKKKQLQKQLKAYKKASVAVSDDTDAPSTHGR